MATVGPRRTKRAARRLAQVRLVNPKALPHVNPSDGYTPREARRVRSKYTRMKAKGKFAAPKAPAPKKPGFDPLAAVTPKNSQQEINAQARLEYGGQENELRSAIGRQEQTTANTGQYYDDYRQALREATGRINETNRVAAETAEGRVDTAYQQDKAGVAQRDAAASEQAAKLGRGPVTTPEGSQAVEAARSQGNQTTGRIRQQSAADTSLMEKRGATAVLAKAQALARENAKRGELGTKQSQLAKEKGDFKVSARGKLRESEREWAAIQKEFGLKQQKLKQDAGTDKASQKVELAKARTQRIVARIYASADRASARAQVRVAKLQLEKGKISKNDFVTIKNIYEGLPAKGKAPAAKGFSGNAGQGSGVGGSLAPWEKDKVDLAVRSLRSAKATRGEQRTMIDKLVKEGKIPARLAHLAWRRYVKGLSQSGANPRGANG